MSNKKDIKNKMAKDEQGVQAIQNQLFESYQKGMVEDQLENNKNIYTFNNRNK